MAAVNPPTPAMLDDDAPPTEPVQSESTSELQQSAASGSFGGAPATCERLPVGMELTEPDVAPQQSSAIPLDRNVKVFRPPPDNTAPSNNIELPDSFFELSAGELKSLLNTQKSKRVARENAGFKTSAFRATEEAAKERRYPKSIIRVRFPDRMQLQGEFSSQAKVSEVYEFVRSSLREPGRDFILYVTPPRKVLASLDETLYKAGLVPASVVCFSWKNGAVRQDMPYVTDQLLEVMENLAMRATTIRDGPDEAQGGLDEKDGGAADQNSVARPGSGGSGKMMKWLKMGKK